MHLLSIIIAIIGYISFLSYDMNCFLYVDLKEQFALCIGENHSANQQQG